MAKKIINLQINFTNKWLYTLITIGTIILLGIGVYAIAPNPGHSAAELDFSGGISGDFVFNDNIKIGAHYFDANDDNWLRIRDGDNGGYKDLAAGKLYVGSDLTVISDLTMRSGNINFKLPEATESFHNGAYAGDTLVLKYNTYEVPYWAEVGEGGGGSCKTTYIYNDAYPECIFSIYDCWGGSATAGSIDLRNCLRSPSGNFPTGNIRCCHNSDCTNGYDNIDYCKVKTKQVKVPMGWIY